MKKIIGVFLSLFFIVLLVGCSGDDASQTKMNEALKVGDIEVTVLDKEEKTKVGNEYFESKAKGVYLLVKVKVENKGKDPFSLISSMFTLKEGDTTYDTDSDASCNANPSDTSGVNFCLISLNPGDSTTGFVAFDVSKKIAGSNDLSLIFTNSIVGGDSGTISLVK